MDISGMMRKSNSCPPGIRNWLRLCYHNGGHCAESIHFRLQKMVGIISGFMIRGLTFFEMGIIIRLLTSYREVNMNNLPGRQFLILLLTKSTRKKNNWAVAFNFERLEVK